MTERGRHHIGEVVFEFEVADARGVLSDADVLARMVQRELLPAIEAACESAVDRVALPAVAIDLGTLPAEPDWVQVRSDLVGRLRAAIAVYLADAEWEGGSVDLAGAAAPARAADAGAAAKRGGAPQEPTGTGPGGGAGTVPAAERRPPADLAAVPPSPDLVRRLARLANVDSSELTAVRGALAGVHRAIIGLAEDRALGILRRLVALLDGSAGARGSDASPGRLHGILAAALARVERAGRDIAMGADARSRAAPRVSGGSKGTTSEASTLRSVGDWGGISFGSGGEDSRPPAQGLPEDGGRSRSLEAASVPRPVDGILARALGSPAPDHLLHAVDDGEVKDLLAELVASGGPAELVRLAVRRLRARPAAAIGFAEAPAGGWREGTGGESAQALAAGPDLKRRLSPARRGGDEAADASDGVRTPPGSMRSAAPAGADRDAARGNLEGGAARAAGEDRRAEPGGSGLEGASAEAAAGRFRHRVEEAGGVPEDLFDGPGRPEPGQASAEGGAEGFRRPGGAPDAGAAVGSTRVEPDAVARASGKAVPSRNGGLAEAGQVGGAPPLPGRAGGSRRETGPGAPRHSGDGVRRRQGAVAVAGQAGYDPPSPGRARMEGGEPHPGALARASAIGARGRPGSAMAAGKVAEGAGVEADPTFRPETTPTAVELRRRQGGEGTDWEDPRADPRRGAPAPAMGPWEMREGPTGLRAGGTGVPKPGMAGGDDGQYVADTGPPGSSTGPGIRSLADPRCARTAGPASERGLGADGEGSGRTDGGKWPSRVAEGRRESRGDAVGEADEHRRWVAPSLARDRVAPGGDERPADVPAASTPGMDRDSGGGRQRPPPEAPGRARLNGEELEARERKEPFDGPSSVGAGVAPGDPPAADPGWPGAEGEAARGVGMRSGAFKDEPGPAGELAAGEDAAGAGRGADSPGRVRMPGRAPAAVGDGRITDARDVSGSGQSPSVAAVAKSRVEGAGETAIPARSGGGGAERGPDPSITAVDGARGDVGGAPMPADAEGGVTLLAVWRSDRGAMRRALAAQGVSGLLALLEAILAGPDGVVPPLGAAARIAAATARNPGVVLRAVIARVVGDRMIDLQSMITAHARAATPVRANPVPGARDGSAGSGPRAADWGAIVAMLDGDARRDGTAHLAAAVREDAGRLGVLLATGGDVARRVGRFVGASDTATRRALLGRLREGADARSVAALEVLCEASAGSAAGFWEVAFLAALERRQTAGGVAGLVRRAVAHAAGDAAAEQGLARELLARLGDGPRAGEVAQALRAMLAGASHPAPDEVQAVRAAGLVVIAPYLPMLFRRLDIVGTTGLLRPESEGRALDVLHALAFGEASERRGGRGVERLLCAVPPGKRLPPPAPLAPGDARTVEDLLAAVVARWGALGQTSVGGLREAFLQREGLLRHRDSGAALEVAPRAYDMLLDRLPWSIALVKFAWMPAPLHVRWRDQPLGTPT